MKSLSAKFVAWLMSLTTLMRYFVIALLFHVLILFVLGSIKIVSEIPRLVANFSGSDLPPQPKDDMDPFAALRDFEYNSPTMGDGRGTQGKGPGGVASAAGTTPTEYKANIAPSDAPAVDSAVTEVIGVVSESSTVMARLQSIGGMMAPTLGMGDFKFGSSGVQGPGGGGPALYGQRSGPMRAQMISKNQGSQEAERAVIAALHWLKTHQDEDGSWGPLNRDAMSALAVLCFLGHGETLDSEEYGYTLSKGLSYLVNLIGSNGLVKSGKMHSQGVVTLALSEGYVMTQSPQIREPLERAVNAIIEAQTAKTGGWRYTAVSGNSDVAVTGWVVMGLTSAKISGLAVSNDSCEVATKYLWNTYAEAEGAGYDLSPEQRYNAVSIDILCQQLLGNGHDKRLKKALDYFKTQKVDWEEPGIGNLYGWYYATQAMYQSGGEYWVHWNKEMRDTLVKAQSADGHWEQPGREVVGLANGPVFSTALCCLMLEVYYRYLPIYREMEKNASSAIPASETRQVTSSK